jgi:hypothetical protein
VCISLNASVQRPGLEPQRGLGRWLFRIIKLNVARLRWLLCITKTQRGLGRWLFRITRLNVAGREEMAVWRVEAFRRWPLGYTVWMVCMTIPLLLGGCPRADLSRVGTYIGWLALQRLCYMA